MQTSRAHNKLALFGAYFCIFNILKSINTYMDKPEGPYLPLVEGYGKGKKPPILVHSK